VSQENVERFVELTETFNRIAGAPRASNLGDVQDLLRVMDPEIQFEPQQSALQGGYVGHEGVTQWLRDLAEHYEGGHMRCADIRDIDDRVLGLGILSFIGRGSGIRAEAPVAIVASFRDGLISHFKDYGDKDRALEAVGLSKDEQ
jgi:ketosteroid isomerase-like protein